MKRDNQRIRYMSARSGKKNKHPIIRYMVYLLIATSVVSGFTYSRYAVSFSGQDIARAASFEYKVTVADKDGNEVDAANVSPLTLTPSIYTTTKLSDAANCMFDEVAVVRKVKVENKSEVAVQAAVANMSGMPDSGIVWCIFNEDLPSSSNYYARIQSELGGSVPAAFASLKTALGVVNQAAIADWNNNSTSTHMGSGASSGVLTIVFWAEYDPVTDSGGFTSAIDQQVEIPITVTQID